MPSHALMRFRAGFFCALAAALRFLSADDATAAKSTASEPAHKKPAATVKERLADAIRPVRAAAPCTPTEVAVFVPDGSA